MMELDRPSPNFTDRKTVPGTPGISMLVMHYTGMETCSEALDRLCDPSAEVSAHLVIDEDGTVHRLVADEYRAWHAGVSYWRGISDVNSASIGIELINPGHEFGYRPFPDAQIDQLVELSLGLIAKWSIPKGNIVGHSDIAPGRKKDPGELFPWPRLAETGVGLWPSNTSAAENFDPWANLAKIGYAVPGDTEEGAEILLPQTAKNDVVSAFQRHFRPSSITGELDPETVSLIGAVAAETP